MQPVPAAVTAWRNTESCTSPAAKTPGTDVRVVPGSTRSEELLGAGTVSTGRTATATGHVARSAATGASTSTGGFWARVGHTLEFWS